MLEYCSAQKSRSAYRPKIGDACCARYTGDDFWYRAIVLGTSAADVKVLYADYGNIETLPLCRVQPIAASHLELPFQIIKCSLEGRQLSHFPIWVSVGFFSFFYSTKSETNGYFRTSLSSNGFLHLLLEKVNRMNCCCTELQKQVGKISFK
ncbi:hypothetical protein J1605_022074 [Eschrichtius robustus]|uniref:Tudor domain-containing protein n=1 Tax=Eschrichtius robustus TaxID=9764 RepID=A0AB34HEG4_ESCRO|nr:hypothetical protein J1605_022074 [Eschrichtius robustus]